MTTQELNNLQTKLDRLGPSLPKPKPAQRPSFFDISEFPHYETVLSNWFAYFLDSSNNSGLSELMANAFQQVLNKQNTSESFDWLNAPLKVFRETMTNKGNFIDLIVFDRVTAETESLKSDESGQQRPTNFYENALVIEHKVKSGINNDLQDYFDSVVLSETGGHKTGIILSANQINSEKAKHPHYVCITYQQLLDELLPNLGAYALEADLTQLTYFKDFLKNLQNMSNYQQDFDALNFCFQHGETIQAVSELKKRAEEQFVNLLKEVCAETNFSFTRKYENSINIKANDLGLVIIIGMHQLFKNKSVSIQVWLYKDTAQAWNQVKDHACFLPLQDRFTIVKKKQGKDWVYILRKDELSFKEAELRTTLETFLTEDMKRVIEIVKKEISHTKEG